MLHFFLVNSVWPALQRKREHHGFQYPVVQYLAEKITQVCQSLCNKLLFEIEISYILSLSDFTGTNSFNKLQSISV